MGHGHLRWGRCSLRRMSKVVPARPSRKERGMDGAQPPAVGQMLLASHEVFRFPAHFTKYVKRTGHGAFEQSKKWFVRGVYGGASISSR